MKTIEELYMLLTRAASSLECTFLLFIRLYWGVQFHTTGSGKLHNIGRVIEYFGSLGIPAPAVSAWFVAWTEFLGGFLLIVGLASRPVALMLALDMSVAYLTADREALAHIFNDPAKFYAADPFTFLFASLVVLIFGPGTYSLDALIAARRGRKEETK